MFYVNYLNKSSSVQNLNLRYACYITPQLQNRTSIMVTGTYKIQPLLLSTSFAISDQFAIITLLRISTYIKVHYSPVTQLYYGKKGTSGRPLVTSQGWALFNCYQVVNSLRANVTHLAVRSVLVVQHLIKITTTLDLYSLLSL